MRMAIGTVYRNHNRRGLVYFRRIDHFATIDDGDLLLKLICNNVLQTGCCLFQPIFSEPPLRRIGQVLLYFIISVGSVNQRN